MHAIETVRCIQLLVYAVSAACIARVVTLPSMKDVADQSGCSTLGIKLALDLTRLHGPMRNRL